MIDNEKVTKEFVDFLLTKCVGPKKNGFHEIVISNVDLSDYKIDVKFENWKVKRIFSSSGLKAEAIWQNNQNANLILQSSQNADSILQEEQKASYINQARQEARAIDQSRQNAKEYINQYWQSADKIEQSYQNANKIMQSHQKAKTLISSTVPHEKTLEPINVKDIPIEPIYVRFNDEDGNECFESARCPHCGREFEVVEEEETYRFCPSCGQSLDWSSYVEIYGE